jgi:tetratricopeptide (TPR) repeat protein
VALDDLGRSEEAIKLFDQALAIDPSDVDALNNKKDALSSLAEQSQNMSTTS